MRNTTLVRIPRGPVFCGARKRQPEYPGQTCRRPSGWGTDHSGEGHCKFHGGATRMQGRHVRLNLARRVAALFAVPRSDIDPVNGLAEELQRSAGLIDSYEAMCAQLLPDEVVYGELTSEESRPSVDADDGDLAPVELKTKSGASLNIWVRLLNEERDRFAKLCEAMIKLDLDARRLTFQQSQVTAIVQLMLSPELALNDDQKRAASRLLRDLDERHAAMIDGEVIA